MFSTSASNFYLRTRQSSSSQLFALGQRQDTKSSSFMSLSSTISFESSSFRFAFSIFDTYSWSFEKYILLIFLLFPFSPSSTNNKSHTKNQCDKAERRKEIFDMCALACCIASWNLAYNPAKALIASDTCFRAVLKQFRQWIT